MTKQEFADMVGISRRTLNRWIKRVDAALLSELGYKEKDHLLTPKVVKYLCEKFVVL